MIVGYFSCNYFVVIELTNIMFNLNLAEKDRLPLGWLFWIFTFAVPSFYIYYGIKKKDIIFIRVGLLLTAAIIFTVRYYYSIVSNEVVMTAGGIVLIVGSYGLTRYLKKPKFGFTCLSIDSPNTDGKLQIESILQVQALTSQQESSDGTKFGGGSFGGGGGSGQY